MNATLSTPLVVLPPSGDKDRHPGKKVWKLLKSLYGLVQAAMEWQKLLTKILVGLNFTACITDPSTYVLWERNKFIIIPTHVDDLYATSNSKRLLNYTWNGISKHVIVKNLGQVKRAMSMTIDWDRKAHIIKIPVAPFRVNT